MIYAMKTLALVILAALFGAVYLGTAPARAENTEPAMIVNPLPVQANGRALIQIEAPADDWGVRAFAKEVDAQFPQIRVFAYGTCAARPEALCVRVHVGAYDDATQLAITGGLFSGYYAVTTFPEPNVREIWLNTLYVPTSALAVAAHEFGHVLGLNHHTLHGVCGAYPDEVHLSYIEKKVLRQYLKAAVPTARQQGARTPVL